MDAAGNIYVAEVNANDVKKIAAGSRTVTTVASGFNFPTSVAVDDAGNIYVADNGNKAIKKVPAGGGPVVTLATGTGLYYGVAVDAQHNVYASDAGQNTITKITSGGTITTIAANLGGPVGIALDAAGNIYVAESANNDIKIIPSGGGTPFVFKAGFAHPDAVTVDASGNVYVADSSVHEISASGMETIVGSGLAGEGLAGDSKGNIYVSSGNTAIKEIKLGGYYITPALPAGLSFAPDNGTITGTPTTISPATVYTIKAINDAGTSTASVTISVVSPSGSSNALLTKLATNSGVVLNQVSGADYKDYAITVPDTLTSITVTPTTQDPSATVKVNGTTVASGSASAAIPLSVGANVINTVVTAQNGVTTKTYGITVTRLSNPLLSSITTNSGASLITVSGPDHRDFTCTVPSATTSITVTAVSSDPSYTIKINGVPVASGSPSAAIPLPYGLTTINTVLTAPDGASNTYSIAVTRPLSNNALLTNLTTNSGVALTEVSGTYYRNYAITVPNTFTGITVTPTVQDAAATVKVNGSTVASGTASASIPLPVGNTVITTVVTAQDGATTKTYSLTVTRAAPGSTNALLTKLNTNTGVALTQVTGTDYRDYTLSLPNSKASMTVTPITQDATATVKVNGVTVASGTASAAIPLQVGNTIITTIVTAQDGTTTKTYGITVTRAAMMALYAPKDSIAADGLVVHPGITPNGDGINDIFTIDGINAYPDNKVTIMGRSGAVIFETKGYDNQSKFFDGHSNKNGSLQLPGTYFYSLEYVADGKTKVKTGFIVLKY